jgi:tetratricopeptide (TPR) repeat protein
MRVAQLQLLVTLLLVGQLARAGEPAFSIASLGSTSAGTVAAFHLASQCRKEEPALCAGRLKAHLNNRRLHPLTRATLMRELAEELRVSGDREAGEKQVVGLGLLRTFEMTVADGAPVVLHADPVSGLVDVGDFVELATDVPRRFVTRLEAQSDLLAWVLVTGAQMELACLDDQCQAVAPMVGTFPDQFVMPVSLVAGASHELALTFSPQADAVRFGVRLVGADGAPLPFVPDGTRTVAAHGLVGRPGRSRGTGGGEGGGLTWLPPLSEESTTGLLLAHCLAAHYTGQNPGEAADRLLARATRLQPADWLPLITCLAGDGRELEAVRGARSSAPGRRDFILAEAAYRASQRQVLRAYELLSQLGDLPTMAGFLDHELVRATGLLREILPAMGFDAVLLAALEAALARAPDRDGLATGLAELLMERERYRLAVETLQGVVARWPGDVVVVNSLVYMLERLGRHPEAAALLERLTWLRPTKTLTLESLAAARERAGDVSAARKLYLALSEKGRFHPFLLDKVASFFLRQGELERALDLWEQVAHLRPQERDVRALLRRLRASGEGPERPLATDDEVRTLAAALPPDGPQPVSGVLDRTYLKRYANGAHLQRRFQAVRVTPNGAGKPFAFQFPYDSHLEEAVVVRAEVLRPDGSVAPATEHGDLSLGGEEFNLYYDLRQMVIRFDSPGAGDILLVVTEIEADPSTLGGPFSGVVWLQDDYPKHHVELAIELPAGGQLFSTAGPASLAHLMVESVAEGPTGRTWRYELESLPPEQSEPFPPGPYERSFYVHYSTMADWPEFASWYTDVITHVGGLDTAMERFLDRIRDATTPPREVAEQVARYVADDVRYVGLELGVHGLRPYAPQEVFGRGFGDCKDKSLLVVTLLGAVGIEAHLVVVPTIPRGQVALTPGSPSIFNHAIVYLPEWDLFFDPTARYLGLGILPWQNQGAQAIVVDGTDSRAVTLPISPAHETVAQFDLLVGPGGAPGAFAVQGTLTFTGQFAWRLLGAMEQQGSWRNTVESYVSSVLPVVAVSATTERVERGDSPAVIVTFEGRFEPGGSTIQLLPDGNSAFALVKRPTRALPMVFGYPYQHRFQVRFAPDTLRFPATQFNASSNDDAAFEVSVADLPDGGQSIRVNFEQRTRRVPPEGYAAFRTLVVQYQEALIALQGKREAK